jgi:hypothetical protein
MKCDQTMINNIMWLLVNTIIIIIGRGKCSREFWTSLRDEEWIVIKLWIYQNVWKLILIFPYWFTEKFYDSDENQLVISVIFGLSIGDPMIG